jgi:hypothetical protein
MRGLKLPVTTAKSPDLIPAALGLNQLNPPHKPLLLRRLATDNEAVPANFSLALLLRFEPSAHCARCTFPVHSIDDTSLPETHGHKACK